MMIELLFTACLLADPTACEEKSLLFTDVTTMQCMMGAQPELAKWAEGHPRWTIERWKCRVLRKDRHNA